MINESVLNTLTISVGTSGNNISSSLINKGKQNIIQLLDDSITKNNNTGNVYTNGLNVFKENETIIYQQLRLFLEKSTVNKLDEINIINSMAGGLGSGVPSDLMRLLNEEFGFTKCLYSNALLWGNNDSMLESYNQLLYLSDITEKIDIITCFDNSFYNNTHLSNSGFNNNYLGFEQVNEEIADNLINAFLGKSERLIDLQKYDNTLKFYIPSTSINENRLFDKQSQLFDVNNVHGNNTIYYGNIVYTNSVDKMLLFDINRLAYSNDSMKICSFIQQENNNNKHYLVSNNNNIVDSLKKLVSNFNKFFAKGAFLQHYLDTISKDEFLDRREVILNIIDDYKAL